MLVRLYVGRPFRPGGSRLAEISHDPETARRWHAQACEVLGLDWSRVSAYEAGSYSETQTTALRRAGVEMRRDVCPYDGPETRAWVCDLDHDEVWLLLAQWQAAAEGVRFTWSFPRIHEIETGGAAYSDQ